MAIRLPKKSKPSKVVGKGTLRPQLESALIRKEGDETVLLATDSYRFVRLPVEVDGEDVLGWVSRDALAAAEESGEFVASDEYIEPSRNGATNGILFRRPKDVRDTRGEQPTWPDLPWPDEPKERFTVGINARFLHELAQALASQDAVKVTFDLTNATGSKKDGLTWLKPIVVEPMRGEGRAMLMPIRVSE